MITEIRMAIGEVKQETMFEDLYTLLKEIDILITMEKLMSVCVNYDEDNFKEYLNTVLSVYLNRVWISTNFKILPINKDNTCVVSIAIGYKNYSLID